LVPYNYFHPPSHPTQLALLLGPSLFRSLTLLATSLAPLTSNLVCSPPTAATLSPPLSGTVSSHSARHVVSPPLLFPLPHNLAGYPVLLTNALALLDHTASLLLMPPTPSSASSCWLVVVLQRDSAALRRRSDISLSCLMSSATSSTRYMQQHSASIGKRDVTLVAVRADACQTRTHARLSCSCCHVMQ
jgi:hypothetical protein